MECKWKRVISEAAVVVKRLIYNGYIGGRSLFGSALATISLFNSGFDLPQSGGGNP